MVDKPDGAVYTITWTDEATANNITPDTDVEVSMKYASSVVIQVDTTATGNTSTDCDVNVHTSPDGTNWDTAVYATEANVGDATIKTFAVTVGPACLRLRLDNNDAGEKSYVTCRVFVRTRI